MKRSARVAAIATGLLTLVGIALPAAAQAAAVSVQSTQVLPPGGASCAALTVVGVTPYVADGQLESFDVTIGSKLCSASGTGGGHGRAVQLYEPLVQQRRHGENSRGRPGDRDQWLD